jgi:hypothetical protein
MEYSNASNGTVYYSMWGCKATDLGVIVYLVPLVSLMESSHALHGAVYYRKWGCNAKDVLTKHSRIVYFCVDFNIVVKIKPAQKK